MPRFEVCVLFVCVWWYLHRKWGRMWAKAEKEGRDGELDNYLIAELPKKHKSRKTQY